MTPSSCQARRWQGRTGRYEPCVKRARASTQASRPRDVLCAVTDCSKHLIAFRGWRAAKEGPAKKRVHVFPDDLSFFGNFEETAEGGLSDQCVAVRQTLRVAHAGREEIPGRLILVLPYDLVCGWIDLDHPRIRHRVRSEERRVGKEGRLRWDVGVGEKERG